MNFFVLDLWIGVVVSSLLLGVGLRRARPRTGHPAPQLHDLSEAAFLTGGPGGVVDTALVSLLSDGRMAAGGPGIVQVRPGARAADPAERAVLQAYAQAPSGWLYQVRYAAMIDPSVQEIGDGLAHRGLLAPPGWGRTWRRWGAVQATVCAVLLVLSLPMVALLASVSSRSEVSAFLGVYPVLIGGFVVGAVCASRAKRRVTPDGRQALRGMRALYGGDGGPQVRTALFGLLGLQDPYLRSLLVPAARDTRLAAAQHRSRLAGSGASGNPRRSDAQDAGGFSVLDAVPVVVWCAASDTGGAGSGSGCGSSGSSCAGGSGSSSGSSGSSCSSGSSGSSCSSSSGSSCSSSSSS
ncbi:TIGR04222 domain-containing membrane protein [Streptomyces sp. NPDC059851]|uniref:TIGR04222 domain-containing membrane protein n=1 Tax=Streptomyces sp. NPDC059851 TaxID=3346971 RepID=UPI00364C3850